MGGCVSVRMWGCFFSVLMRAIRIAGRTGEQRQNGYWGLAMGTTRACPDENAPPHDRCRRDIHVYDTHTWSEADVVNDTEHLLMDFDNMKGPVFSV